MPVSPFIFNNASEDGKKSVSADDYNELKQRYDALFEGNFDIVYVHRLDGKLVDANTAATEILEYSKEELMGMSILDIIDKEHHAEIAEIFSRIAVEGSKGASREYKAKTKSGKTIWLNTRSNILIVKDGEMLVQGFAHDVTHRRFWEEELLIAKRKAEESDRLKSAFLANMSHEIRTPLNAILGFADIVAHDELEMEQIRSFSNMILKNGEFLMNLLTDIIDIAKIESDQIKILKKEVNITDLLIEVDSTIKNSHNFKQKKNVGLHVVLPKGDDIIAFTDDMRLKQVLYNLINNAFKFTDKGKVTVSFKQVENMLEFTVSDTGSGIEKKYEKVIFERFGQGDFNNPANYNGTGLGLSICNGLVILLGGDIGMRSEPGVGSDFYFTITITN